MAESFCSFGHGRDLVRQIFGPQIQRLTGAKNTLGTGLTVNWRLPTFFNHASPVRKVERVKLQPPVGAGQTETNAVALHQAPDAARCRPQQVAEIQIRYNLVSQIEEQRQTLFGAPGSLKVQR